ncbi:MAG TPA: alpha-amylase family glycosyl hydrolase [Pyrinomonadaceae bacterium]|nr:alpha-amylase family glycosyl hydrolase [Pyrinomonadaceae bacterium]
MLKAVVILILLLSSSAALAQPRNVPDWVRDGVIYEIYPRAFSQQGNFNAITDRLDELKDLGVTILWLMPIHPIGQEKKKGTIGSPYAVRDYYAINPDYGTANDLKRLVREAHARGLKVIIDVVANHTSWDSVLMKHPEFYKRDAKGNITYPYDWYDIAALNYNNQQLRRYMIDMLKYWIREFNLDGFRCDVAGEVPTDFWETARAELEKVKPEILMLAEAHKAELLVKAFDLDYSWPLHSALSKVLQGLAPASELRVEWQKEVEQWPKGALHMRFSDNHDERRAIARFGERAALAASAFVFTLDGVPMIYNGMEVGDTTESGAPALFEKLPIFWPIGERRPEFRRTYKQLMSMRRGSKALRRGTLEWVENSDELRVVSFVRRADGEEVLVAINFSSVPFVGTVGSSAVRLDPWQYMVMTNSVGNLVWRNPDARWPTAAKNGFGTSVTLGSKVWFTLTNGVMTEVFYPTVDVPNVETLQLIVLTDERTELETHDTIHRLELPSPGSLTFRQVNTAKSGQYTITKTYVTDPQRNTVLIDVEFDSRVPAGLSVYYDPSLYNSGKYDLGWTEGNALVAVDGNIASALVSNCGLESHADLVSQTENTNVVQIGTLKRPEPHRPAKLQCTIALGFGESVASATNAARGSLARGFAAIRSEYEAGWRRYTSGLPRVDAQHQRQFNMAAMVLRALEDKTFRGAVIASPSSPWGGGPNANEPTVSGYHAVWARDLYHVATAFIALGEFETADRLLNYLFFVQQKSDGSFPRNSWVDGRPTGDGLQMDQVALPIVLAYQLKRTDADTWQSHVKPAADFIVRRGPRTDQDRWEEKSGYFPGTIAAEIAGLVCAAEIARINGDTTSAATYLKTADDWARNIQLVDPARVDAGFLELVRLGIKAARDRSIVDAVALVDETLRVRTPAGEAWYRYNNDTYGETPTGGDFDGRNGVGRLWTLLTGERGQYEIAAGDLAAARKRLDTMAQFANDGLMIPEQVWDRQESPNAAFRFGAGTGSATPLAWSMAQFIRLAINLKLGRNLETPDIVAQRYLSK